MKNIYILVLVKSGLIQEPEIFATLKEAQKKEKILRSMGFNPDYDEIGTFKKSLIKCAGKNIIYIQSRSGFRLFPG